MTGRNDLQKLTLANYGNFLSGIRLLKKHKSWCPFCLKESGNNPYEKAIWNFNLVENCHIHNCKLEERCPKCDSFQKLILFKTLNGFCQKCCCWLGTEENNLKSDHKVKLEYEYLIGSLLKNIPDNKLHSKEAFLNNLNNLWNLTPSPKGESWEKFVGISKGFVNGSLNDRNKKYTLINLLKICIFLNVTFNELINTNLTLYPDVFYKSNSNIDNRLKWTGRNKVNVQQLKEKLVNYINGNDYLNLNALSKKIGYSYNTIKLHFPDLLEEIIRLNREKRKERAIEKKNERMDLIRSVTIDFYQSGVYPSFRKIQSKLPFVITGYEKEYGDKWEGTLKELGIKK